jgi:hypothetical protein
MFTTYQLEKISIWRFPEMGVPLNDQFLAGNFPLNKPTILGIPQL